MTQNDVFALFTSPSLASFLALFAFFSRLLQRGTFGGVGGYVWSVGGYKSLLAAKLVPILFNDALAHIVYFTAAGSL